MPQVPDSQSVAPAMLHHPPAMLHPPAAMLHPPPPSLHPPTPSLGPVGTGEGPRMRPTLPAPTPFGTRVVELPGGARRWQKRDAGQCSSQDPGKESPDADHAAPPAARAARFQVRSEGNWRETLRPASALKPDQARKLSRALARLTCRSRLNAFSLIWRTRSRVIPSRLPISSSVIGSGPSSPK
jgi:hypothetical protein